LKNNPNQKFEAEEIYNKTGRSENIGARFSLAYVAKQNKNGGNVETAKS
jgi:hypothetical protein